MPGDPILRIGTRGSPLALRQTNMVIAALVATHPKLGQGNAVQTVVIKTTGDRVQEVVLAALGGKGLFTKELDEALLAGTIDLAIHSMKDVPTFLPPGILLSAILEREDVRDVLVSKKAKSLAELPKGAVVGTASLRRRAQLLMRRPDLSVVPLRGNVDTRIAKIAAGEADATLLAYAGLKRLGKAEAAVEILSTDTILPAVGQGALAVTWREGDKRTTTLVEPLVDAATQVAVRAERAMLAVLDGSCQTPIAGLATVDGKILTLNGLLAHPDGTEHVAASGTGPVAEAEPIGQRVANELLLKAGPGLIRALKKDQPHVYRVPSGEG
jgi:hydroxymethylbilane synthase